MAIALSVIFWLTPICLMVHLALNQKKTRQYKQRWSYIYGGIWAIAWMGYVWLFFQQ